MAIYTPQGLKIRVSLDFAFALMARLYPRVGAFRVLKTAEGIEEIPSAVSSVVAVFCLLTTVTPMYIAIWTIGSYLAVGLLRQFGVFVLPGLIALGTFKSHLTFFSVPWDFLALMAYAYYAIGWVGVTAIALGKIGGRIVLFIVEMVTHRRAYRRTGVNLTSSEDAFFHAYLTHAEAVNAPMNLDVSSEELREEYWRDCYTDLAHHWPEVVRRFTDE